MHREENEQLLMETPGTRKRGSFKGKEEEKEFAAVRRRFGYVKRVTIRQIEVATINYWIVST